MKLYRKHKTNLKKAKYPESWIDYAFLLKKPYIKISWIKIKIWQ